MSYAVWLLRNQMGVRNFMAFIWVSFFFSFFAIADLGMFLLMGKPFILNFRD